MNRLRISFLTAFALLVVCIGFSQTGVHYFLNNNVNQPHSKIIDIAELDENQTILLTQISDDKYIYHNLDLLLFNQTKQTVSYNQIELENLHDIISLKNSNNGFSVFANTSLNKSYKPLKIEINKELQKTSLYEDPVVFSTLISDVIDGINYRLILYTKIGKSDKYNISLHKINLNTNKVEWLKKISSEQNEEADKIIVDPDGNILILGKKYNDEVTSYVPIVYKLDNEGNQIWKKGIDVPNNFTKQSFCLSDDNHLIYICGYTKNSTGFSESRIIKLSATGEELENTEITEFSANGMIILNNGNYLAYGSEFLVDQKQIVTKGKFVLIGKNLALLKSKALDANDKPDCDLNTEIKTSSDFIVAKELKNGKIALGGKVYMPNKESKNGKHNIPLLMLINKDGTY